MRRPGQVERPRTEEQAPRPGRGLRLAIAAFPVVFALHDAEEAIGAERTNAIVVEAVTSRSPRVPAKVAEWMTMSPAEMAAAGVFVFVLGAAVSLRLLNSVMHVGQTIVLRRYVPGVGTSAAVGLPFSGRMVHGLRDHDLVGRGDMARGMLYGLLLMPPAVLTARAVGKLAVHMRGRRPKA